MNTILIDTNVFSKVFDPNNEEHNNYALVYQAIMKGKGKVKIIFGGTKYKIEIAGGNMSLLSMPKLEPKYQKKIAQLKIAKLIIEYNDEEVDKEQITVLEKFIAYYDRHKSRKGVKFNVQEFDIERVKKLILEIQNNKCHDEKIILYKELLSMKPDFDDPHIIALLNVSKCKNICTEDVRSEPFLKAKFLYNDKIPPKIHKKPIKKLILKN